MLSNQAWRYSSTSYGIESPFTKKSFNSHILTGFNQVTVIKEK